MHQSVKDAFIPFNEPLEAREPYMYLDSKSLVSTGIGNPIEEDDMVNFGTNPQLKPIAFTLGWFCQTTNALASNAEIEQEYQKVKFSGTANQTLEQKKAITQLRISNQTIDNLVMSVLDSFENTLRGRQPFAGWISGRRTDSSGSSA